MIVLTSMNAMNGDTWIVPQIPSVLIIVEVMSVNALMVFLDHMENVEVIFKKIESFIN